jgi:hypothetical protein
MTFKTQRSQVRIIRQDERAFIIQDGLVLSPRAGFEINQACPQNYRNVIAECIEYGWLKPVAYVKDSELMWDTLQQ